jgi:hypothetical protein
MKSTNCLSLLLVIALEVAGCAPAGSTTIPTQVETPVSSPTLFPPTSTSTVTPSATVTPTLPPTLGPEQAKETIRTLLQEPVDCEAPCFWGIMPGQTTLDEATNIFVHLGLSLKFTATLDGKDFYAANYNLHDGIEVSPVIAIQNNSVKSLDVGINDTSEVGDPRKWTAYSPETLIQRYGSPSRVEFSLGRVDNPSHTMILYFESVHMIILYIGRAEYFLNNKNTLKLCPLINKVDFIQFWMGDDPQYPPPVDVPLEKATSLTIEDFSKLMIGEPAKACFNLKEEAFP